MSLKLEYDNEEKILYFDNILVSRIKRGHIFLSIYVTDKNASITRYCVPGRIDTYAFTWISSNHCGIGDRVAFFTDTNTSLNSSVKQVRKDLKNKYVKQLLKEA